MFRSCAWDCGRRSMAIIIPLHPAGASGGPISRCTHPTIAFLCTPSPHPSPPYAADHQPGRRDWKIVGRQQPWWWRSGIMELDGGVARTV